MTTGAAVGNDIVTAINALSAADKADPTLCWIAIAEVLVGYGLSGVIDLGTGAVTGTLPIARGGTNSGTALNNGRVLITSGGKMVESGAATDGQLFIGSTGLAPVPATLGTGNGITATGGAGTLSISQTFGTDASHAAAGNDPRLPASPIAVPALVKSGAGRVTADQTTSSGSFVDLTGATVTLTTSAGTKVLVLASWATSNTGALGNVNTFGLNIDGSVDSGSTQTFCAANSWEPGSFIRLVTGLSAGSHTFKIQWATSATARCRPATAPNNEHASIVAVEIAL